MYTSINYYDRINQDYGGVMDTSVEITVLHNCALIIRAGGDALMIDTLSRGVHPFDGISAEDEVSAVKGSGAFVGIRCALYTHTHGDHYDKELNDVYASKFGIPMFIPDRDLGLDGKFSIGPFSVRYHRISHSGKEYADVRHYVFKINVWGRCIYVTGDADFNSNEHFTFLNGIKPDAAFFNPFYLSSHEDTLKRIAPKRAFIYHIPSKVDSEGIRQMAFDSFKHHEELWSFCSMVCEHPHIIKI